MAAHRARESSTGTLVMAKVTPQVIEVLKEPSQIELTVVVEDITKFPKVFEEPPQIDQSKVRKMHVDGPKNSLGAGARVVLKSPKRTIFDHCLRLNFFHNEQRLPGLRSSNKLLVPELHIFRDSKLVAIMSPKSLNIREPKWQHIWQLRRLSMQ